MSEIEIKGFPACYNPECTHHHVVLNDNLQDGFNIDNYDRSLVSEGYNLVNIKRYLYKHTPKDSIYYCGSCHGAIQHNELLQKIVERAIKP